MPFQDYEEFIASLNEHHVRYLIVGAQALAHHARPRATKDLDIWIDPAAANAKRVLAAMHSFFGADTGYTVRDLTDRSTVIQLGVAPVRIDILSGLSGVARFSDAWKNRTEGTFGTARTYFIGLEELILSKEAADRLQDRADVRVLKRAKAKQSKVRQRRKH